MGDTHNTKQQRGEDACYVKLPQIENPFAFYMYTSSKQCPFRENEKYIFDECVSLDRKHFPVFNVCPTWLEYGMELF